MKIIRVWDLFVRVFHWSLLVLITTQLATAEDFQSVHVTAGHFIIALLILRIIWGFIGSEHARFKDFIYPPADIIDYLKGLFNGRAKRYIGHNPAGGAMACFLLFILVLTTLTGLLTYGAEGKGPLAFGPVEIVTVASASEDHHDFDGEGEGSHFWKEIHESLVGILIFLASVHVCGVIASSYVHKENLVLGMVTGNKKIE